MRAAADQYKISSSRHVNLAFTSVCIVSNRINYNVTMKTNNIDTIASLWCQLVCVFVCVRTNILNFHLLGFRMFCLHKVECTLLSQQNFNSSALDWFFSNFIFLCCKKQVWIDMCVNVCVWMNQISQLSGVFFFAVFFNL